MIFNRDKKFMVFMPWKTASSTLYLRLVNFNQSPYSRFYYFNEHLKRVVHQHITVADFKSLPENIPDYKRAAFIRNPYDRVYSGFKQIQQDLTEQPQLPFPQPWIKNHVIKQLQINQQKLDQADYDFDKWVSLLDPEDIYQIGGNSSLPLHPAHYWTHDTAEQFVQFIGRVETFEEDFIKLLDFLKIPDGYTKENDNIGEPQSESDVTTYKYIHKMSRNSIDKINFLFEKDFQLFGYKTW
jgi:hypothetical protein